MMLISLGSLLKTFFFLNYVFFYSFLRANSTTNFKNETKRGRNNAEIAAFNDIVRIFSIEHFCKPVFGVQSNRWKRLGDTRVFRSIFVARTGCQKLLEWIPELFVCGSLLSLFLSMGTKPTQPKNWRPFFAADKEKGKDKKIYMVQNHCTFDLIKLMQDC